jgi:Uma2 family endonuclease
MTVEEYLGAEESQPFRREYVDGRVFAMTGATAAHNAICTNLLSLVHAHLRGTGCRAYANDMKVKIESINSFYYPDILVTCEPFSPKAIFTTAPVLIVEILSPSTKHIDRREKVAAYKQISGLKEYLIISQNKHRVEMFQRGDDDIWQMMVVEGNERLLLKSLSPTLELPLTSIYEGLGIPNMVREEEEAEYDCDSDY